MFPVKKGRFFPLTMEIGANLSPENVTGVLLNQKYILKFVKDTNEHIQFLGGCRIFRGCHVWRPVSFPQCSKWNEFIPWKIDIFQSHWFSRGYSWVFSGKYPDGKFSPCCEKKKAGIFFHGWKWDKSYHHPKCLYRKVRMLYSSQKKELIRKRKRSNGRKWQISGPKGTSNLL